MALFDDLRPVIQLIDDLRDCGIDSKISLPRIAVIGTQSAGKSSLLESIVGLDFLPRGDGVVTRRPLELRLIHIDDADYVTSAQFGDEDKTYHDFQEVKRKIEEKTNEVAGSKKNIVNKPITLTVHSHDCPTLTMIDLPGITRVPMKNSDQPEDIERITKEMTMHYIEDERTIILCVAPANSDLTTSDAINLARKVDIDGERTLGVLTKIDLIDKGTSILPTLKNEIIELKHGYIAVKNRSQADIQAKMEVSEALELERKYFEEHKELRAHSDYCGTDNLSKKLSSLLYEQIKTNLPSIRQEIDENFRTCEKELQRLGEPFPENNTQKLYYLITKSKEISEDVRGLMEGKKPLISKTGKIEFQGFAYLQILISKFYMEKNTLFVNGLKDLQPVEVILDIIESKAFSLPGFLPKEIIEKKIWTELEQLKNSVKSFISDVKTHNSKILKFVFDSKGSLGSEVKRVLNKIALDYLEKLAKETQEYICRLIDIEKEMIWTNDFVYFTKDIGMMVNTEQVPNAIQTYNGKDYKLHKTIEFIKTEIPGLDLAEIRKNISNFPTYLRTRPEFLDKFKQIEKSKLQVSNLVSEEEVVYFYEKLIRYYNVLNRNLSDTIPKIVVVSLVKDYYGGLERFFTDEMSEKIDQLTKVCEDNSIAKRRATYKDIFDKLLKSKEVLQTFDGNF